MASLSLSLSVAVLYVLVFSLFLFWSVLIFWDAFAQNIIERYVVPLRNSKVCVGSPKIVSPCPFSPPLSLSQLNWTVAVWEQHKYTTILTCNTIRTYNCHWLDADLDNRKSYNLIHIWIWDELFCSILDISPPKPKMMCQKFSLHLTRLILCYKYIIDWGGITWQWLFWHFESEFKKQIQINWEYKSIFMLFDI